MSRVCLPSVILSVFLAKLAALQQTPGNATLFEGARLIMGDGKAPIDRSAFIVANDRFTSVGKKQISAAMAIGACFVWIRQELVEAWSFDAASFALIIYYALAGLALIFAGRWRRVGLWSAVGLGLAFYAGYKTLVQTFTIDAVGLRVGARILVGVFLAAVAYWYRVPSAPASNDPPGADEAPAESVGAMASK